VADGTVTLGERFQARWAGEPSPWYLAEKARSGAFAAFLGVRLTPSKWQAIAVGDCCLFHEQDHAMKCSFPISDPAAFSNSPILVPSRPQKYESILPHVVVKEGPWSPGASLTLMSDAVAAWYLRERLARSRKATLLSRFIAENDVELVNDMISDERSSRSMRNDDVAIVRITWPKRFRR
jgi:hypothetical protein